MNTRLLVREDIGHFLSVWRRAYLPTGLVMTPAVKSTIAALEELADSGGTLLVDEPTAAALPAAAPYADAAPDDDIPF